MKKATRFILYLGALLMGGLFTGCNPTFFYEEAESDPVIAITTHILPRNESRVQTDTSGKDSFETDDRLTLYIQPKDGGVSQKRSLTNTASGWIPQLTWTDLATRQATFTAFYPPVSSETNGMFTHTVASDQREAATYTQSDLLWATTSSQQGEPVHLAFRHALSRIVLTLKSEHTFTSEQLATAVIKLQACPSVQVHSFTGALKPTAAQVSSLIFHPEGKGTYSLILPPQPIQEAWHNGWIDIQVGNQQFTYKAPTHLNDQSRFTALEAGKQVTFHLTIDQQAVEEEWAGKTVWVYGLKDIPSPEGWNYAGHNGAGVGILGLKWDARYGWFDCNKRDPNKQQTDSDSEMCWAASSSNLIHWWLEQNKEFVARYSYTGPSAYENSVDSKIFQLYRDRFPNKGNDVAAALSWFFTGRFGTESNKGPGYFKDLLGANNPVATIVSIHSGYSLSKALKEAFTRQDAIECTIEFPGKNLLHAINIWGAEFDQQGEVSVIYITDNNDTDLYTQNEGFDFLGRKKTQAGLIRKPVRKGANGNFFMEGSIIGRFEFEIILLNTLGLKRTEWEAYFKKQKPAAE